MGYIFKNQHGVITVQDEATINEPKFIHFITPDYKELFQIADGEQVLLCYPDGEKTAYTCKYLDDYHFMLGWKSYHICEFAERMRDNGITVLEFPQKRMIWSNIDLNLKDWEGLREEYPNYDEKQLTEEMYEINNDYLAEERHNLKIQCDNDIIVFGNIERWNGRVQGYKIIESGKISDCLYTDCDMAEWYVDRDGDLCSTQIHHDGTNYLYYRKFKNDLSSDDREDFLEKFYDGKATQEDIDRVTDKLGGMLGAVYGWEMPTVDRHSVQQRE